MTRPTAVRRWSGPARRRSASAVRESGRVAAGNERMVSTSSAKSVAVHSRAKPLIIERPRILDLQDSAVGSWRRRSRKLDVPHNGEGGACTRSAVSNLIGGQRDAQGGAGQSLHLYVPFGRASSADQIVRPRGRHVLD